MNAVCVSLDLSALNMTPPPLHTLLPSMLGQQQAFYMFPLNPTGAECLCASARGGGREGRALCVYGFLSFLPLSPVLSIPRLSATQRTGLSACEVRQGHGAAGCWRGWSVLEGPLEESGDGVWESLRAGERGEPVEV